MNYTKDVIRLIDDEAIFVDYRRMSDLRAGVCRLFRLGYAMCFGTFDNDRICNPFVIELNLTARAGQNPDKVHVITVADEVGDLRENVSSRQVVPVELTLERDCAFKSGLAVNPALIAAAGKPERNAGDCIKCGGYQILKTFSPRPYVPTARSSDF